MMELNKISSVYFLGIGGIGMSALARYFKSTGAEVSGYDKTETVLTSELQKEGIRIHFEDDVEFIERKAELVVYTPAIPKAHKGYNYFLENGFTLMKRSEVLGIITREMFSICVAGTHGKTTTSAMIAHILRHSGYGCNAFLGGIASNYASNFWMQETAPVYTHGRTVAVAEADEYDRSFLKLFPNIAVITAMDADHLDIYGNVKNLEDAFIAFAGQVKPGGLLLSKYGLERSGEFKVDKNLTYSMSDTGADVYAENVRTNNGSYIFDLKLQSDMLKDIIMNMGGMHNIENVAAAISVATHLGIESEKIKAAVETFRGVKRRFEYIIKTDELVMIDDYAHHPEELRALISGAKDLFPGRKCTVLFQPHLYSRTRDFADGFAEVLDEADKVFLLPIYPAREQPIEGVESEMIAARMKNKDVEVITKVEVLQKICNSAAQLLITAGAGDIDTLVASISEKFKNQDTVK